MKAPNLFSIYKKMEEKTSPKELTKLAQSIDPRGMREK